MLNSVFKYFKELIIHFLNETHLQDLKGLLKKIKNISRKNLKGLN